ncbi:MAG: alkaline phosphatase family protein [Anaerolineae bacterium]|nr:alkaline phosphatase family protein [Thermoflexales bacterium]MDW8395202.1 alkaline phosphatase family protein [Anaerolineae bacterium]
MSAALPGAHQRVPRRIAAADLRRLLVSLSWFIVTEALLLAFLAMSHRATWTADALLRWACASFIAASANFFILPVLIWLRAPSNPLLSGAVTIGVNVCLFSAGVMFVFWEIPREADWLVLSALPFAIANALANGAIALDDDYTFLQFVLASLRQPASALDEAPPHQRGLVVLEIDGLSHPHLQQALSCGLMPCLAELLRTSHCLAEFWCGLPSQTSSAQALLLHGTNENIPGFRWFDRQLGRVLVSNHPDDAALLNQRLSDGRGLLRGGVSINNLLDGDAARSLLTLSTLSQRYPSPIAHALDDLTAFWLNPYTFGRTLAVAVSELLREVGQALRQQITERQRHLGRRFPSRFTVLRVVTNVLMRDLAAFAVMREMQRGKPIIYATFVGYDEVAHYAGPDSTDALSTLRGFDRHLRHILQVARYFAPIAYEVVLLSDHGQSRSTSFQRRYGYSLRELVDALTDARTRVSEVLPVEAGQSFAGALSAELEAASQALKRVRGRRTRRTAMRLTSVLLRQLARTRDLPNGDLQDIIVCPSGNLANVYFRPARNQRVSLEEIRAEHPGLLEALVAHPGIGFVIGRDVRGHVWALSKAGARNLSTGEQQGADPFGVLGGGERWANEWLKLAGFSTSGDLILNSMVYPDGSVASFEDSVGCHGGGGGAQTSAFVVYPRHLDLPCPLTDIQSVRLALERWREARD